MKLSVQDINLLKYYFAGKPVEKAYVFGSYSRNEADADSDIDILVELDYNQHIGLGFIGMQLDLEEQLKRKVDLVSDKGVSPILRPFIDKDKVLVYAR